MFMKKSLHQLVISFIDPQLRDPICEGSVVQIGEYTAFSNPPMSYARANLSIALSKNGGQSWDYRLCLTQDKRCSPSR